MTRSRNRLCLTAALSLAAAAIVLGVAQAEEGVYASAEDVQPLAVGARVPSAPVRSVRGEPVDLAERTRDHGALLVFYRGGW